ncbi:DUF6011 domain-containing protein [Mycolicibacterium pulveris]|uniref:DUF6011 domain-containing protein n=1 Tax=Mycolicibacterium pulveris TaxID=36813 RepID=UPI003CF6F62A
MGEGPTPGFYWGDDGIYKVRISKAGHWYAMRAVPNPNGHRVGWHYVGQRVHLNEPMTAAEAGRFTCHCMVCGSRLDTPESRERGMGPICAKRVNT